VDEDGKLILTAENVRLELAAAPRPFRSEQQSGETLLREFTAADSSQDSRQDGRIRREDNPAGFLAALFPLLDRDHDDVVTRDEAERYVQEVLPLEAAAAASRLTLVVSSRGDGLFDLADRNRDGRLGLRELRELPQLAKELDRSGDGALAPEEAGGGFVLALREESLAAP
jgi:hypothetical protein